MNENVQFSGGNTSYPADEYRERKKYINYLRTSVGYDLLDTHDTNRLYGLINKNYEIIMPNCPAPTVFGDYVSDVTSQRFIVTQFNKFRDFFFEKMQTTSIQPPPAVASLTPTKGIEDFEEKYLEYQPLFIPTIFDYIREEKHQSGEAISLQTFSDYLTDSIFSPEMRDFPITKTGFATSPYCSIHTTGIYVDLGDQLSPHFDQQKGEMLQSSGFECYVEYANLFGFYVDAHNPWRLIADVNSEPMRAEILNNRPPDRFEDFYHNEYLFKVALNGAGAGGDYVSIQQFYKKAYIEYCTEYIGTLPAGQSLVIPSAGPAYWLKKLIIHKLKEMEQIYSNPLSSQDEQEINLYSDVLQKSLDRLGTYGLTSISGAEGYLMNLFSQFLKERMESQGGPESNSNTRY